MIELDEKCSIYNFFKNLDELKIKYAVWKNINSLDLSFNGLFNFDLYVSLDDYKKFHNLAKSQKLIKLNNQINKIKFIEHFYILGKNNKIFHIHVYYKIITGESFLKEYELPLEDLILRNRIRHKYYDIWIINDELNACIFIIRHFLKTGSLISRNLYLKDIKKYTSEWNSISNKKKESFKNFQFLNSSLLEKSNLFNNNFKLPNQLDSLKFRYYFRKFCRYKYPTLIVKRQIILINQFLNKYIFKKKKFFDSFGMIISFCGVDGSGKTTMKKDITKIFEDFITTNSYHIGKPQGQLLSYLIFKTKKYKNFKNLKKDSSIISSLISIALVLARYLLAMVMKFNTKKGGLVFVDRWPTNKLNCMDGPRINYSISSNLLIKFLKFIESKIYDNFINSDLCIFFNVTLDTALLRNKKRIKKDKETSLQIINRYKVNSKVRPITKKIIEFDNNSLYNENIEKLMKIVWEEISLKSFEK